jgi:hypothetical protein
MDNHFLHALVQRKIQLRKELEAIEVLENSMAQINTNVLPAMPETKPKREVIATKRRLTTVPEELQLAPSKKPDVKLRQFLTAIYNKYGAFEFFSSKEKAVGEGNNFIVIHNEYRQLRLVDFKVNASNQLARTMRNLCRVPDGYDCNDARAVFMQIHNENKSN